MINVVTHDSCVDTLNLLDNSALTNLRFMFFLLEAMQSWELVCSEAELSGSFTSTFSFTFLRHNDNSLTDCMPPRERRQGELYGSCSDSVVCVRLVAKDCPRIIPGQYLAISVMLNIVIG